MALAYNLPGALHTDSFTVGDYTYTGNSVYVDDGMVSGVSSFSPAELSPLPKM